MNRKHGMCGTPEHRAWSHMKNRCSNSNLPQYKDYGGRGIKVCDEWKTNFLAFYEHIGPKPSPRHSIDRIDVDGNYEPGNVRWATPLEQRHNRRPFVRGNWQSSKLSDKDIADIRQRYAEGESMPSINKSYPRIRIRSMRYWLTPEDREKHNNVNNTVEKLILTPAMYRNIKKAGYDMRNYIKSSSVQYQQRLDRKKEAII